MMMMMMMMMIIIIIIIINILDAEMFGMNLENVLGWTSKVLWDGHRRCTGMDPGTLLGWT
eukprot:1608824-Karenia_brevis.AAC.1